MNESWGWHKISIAQYQEIARIETENELAKFIETIAIVINKDPEEIRNLPLMTWKKLAQEMDFLKTEPESDIKTRFVLDDTEYGLEPDMSLMSAGVFIDAEQFRREPIENLHRTLALVYRPIIGEDKIGYKIAPHEARGFEARAELFREKLSIEQVIGTVVFFSLLGMELSIVSMDSLKEEMMKIQNTTKKKNTIQKASRKNNKQNSKRNGASTTP